MACEEIPPVDGAREDLLSCWRQAANLDPLQQDVRRSVVRHVEEHRAVAELEVLERRLRRRPRASDEYRHAHLCADLNAGLGRRTRLEIREFLDEEAIGFLERRKRRRGANPNPACLAWFDREKWRETNDPLSLSPPP